MHAPVVTILTHVLVQDLEVSEALLGKPGAVLRHHQCGSCRCHFGCCAVARSVAVRIVALHRRVDAVQLGRFDPPRPSASLVAVRRPDLIDLSTVDL